MRIRLSLLALLAVLASAAPARATPPLYDELTALSRVVPAGGVIVLEGRCSGTLACTWPSTLEVHDEAGQPVEGRFEAGQWGGGSWGVFVPDAPLEAGTTLTLYSAKLHGGSAQSAEIEVVAPAAFDPATIELAVRFEEDLQPTSACCSGRGQLPGDAGICFERGERRRLDVYAELRGREQATNSQYAYELTFVRAGGEYPTEFTRTPLANPYLQFVEYQRAAPEYCYRVRARPVRGGEIVQVAAACVPNTVPEVGEVLALTQAQIDERLASCVVPDAGSDAGPNVKDAASTRDAASASVEARGEGCQLADDHVGALSAGFILLALAASGRRRRS